MANFLPQTLINLRAGIMPAGLQREISEHAGIPNTAAHTLAEKRVIANVKTVTGRADKSADAATEAGGRLRLPELV